MSKSSGGRGGSRSRRGGASKAGSASKVRGARFTGRQGSEKLRSAKGRPIASTRWLQRQLNDPYVAEAKRRGYRSRAAFKLIEMDDKLQLLKPGALVVDLGAAPGGWCQVAAERVGENGRVVGLDLVLPEPLPGIELLEGDFREPDCQARLKAALGGPADLVLSDMAASATGHAATDHLRIMALAEAALDFAEVVLRPGGAFLAKVLQGGTERELLDRMKRNFAKVRHIKPPASRKDSAELYVVAIGYRG